jgi:hypothetical protein
VNICVRKPKGIEVAQRAPEIHLNILAYPIVLSDNLAQRVRRQVKIVDSGMAEECLS